MQGVLDRCLGSKFVFGDDFNVAKCSSNIECMTLRNLCSSNNLLWCDVDVSCDVNYTFHNDTTNCRSMIDYFICSPDITLHQCKVIILNDEDNMLDHFAIACKLGVEKLTARGHSVTAS